VRVRNRVAVAIEAEHDTTVGGEHCDADGVIGGQGTIGIAATCAGPTCTSSTARSAARGCLSCPATRSSPPSRAPASASASRGSAGRAVAGHTAAAAVRTSLVVSSRRITRRLTLPRSMRAFGGAFDHLPTKDHRYRDRVYGDASVADGGDQHHAVSHRLPIPVESDAAASAASTAPNLTVPRTNPRARAASSRRSSAIGHALASPCSAGPGNLARTTRRPPRATVQSPKKCERHVEPAINEHVARLTGRDPRLTIQPRLPTRTGVSRPPARVRVRRPARHGRPP
jgi:hypothetical protein